MRDTKENYICKSVAEFRKSHPDFLEHREFTGKKKRENSNPTPIKPLYRT